MLWLATLAGLACYVAAALVGGSLARGLTLAALVAFILGAVLALLGVA